jgi:hypothetical protein
VPYDRAGGTSDSPEEAAEKQPAEQQLPPPDRPGAENVPSRAESRRAVAVDDQVNDQPVDDKPSNGEQEVAAAPQEPAGERDTEADEGTSGSAEPVESTAEDADERTETPNDEPATRRSDGAEVADEEVERPPTPSETAVAEESDQGPRGTDSSAENTGHPEPEQSEDVVADEQAALADAQTPAQDRDAERTPVAEEDPPVDTDATGSEDAAEPLLDESEVRTSHPEGSRQASGEGQEQDVQEPEAPQPKHDDAEKDQQEAVGPLTDTSSLGSRDKGTSEVMDGREPTGPSGIQESSDDGHRAVPDQDEPGSWRGDNGEYLNNEENLVTDHALDRIQACEARITVDLQAIEREVPGGELTGLEFRLKGEERFKEKVADETRDKPELSIGRIAEAVPDAVRYTYRFDKDNYVQGYGQVRQQLEDRGYTMVFSRNSWDTPQYKGVNTRWRTLEGQLFEVQFHTPESFAAKQETHGAYERIRSPGVSKQEVRELRAFQREVSARIPMPDEVNTIPDYREKGY